MRIIYADGNWNDVGVSPITARSTGQIVTNCVFSVTLNDPNGNPIAGATAMTTTYNPTLQDNMVTCQADLSAYGTGCTMTAVATGSYAGAIKFTNSPINVVLRQ
jgi:hypothetical protein